MDRAETLCLNQLDQGLFHKLQQCQKRDDYPHPAFLGLEKGNEGDKAALEGGDTVSVLQAQPTLIKRPVLEWNDRVSVGFKAEEYGRLFNI